MESNGFSVRILNAKDKPLDDEEIHMLAEIEVHPEIRKWDTDVHTEVAEEMCQLFRKFFEELPANERQGFLVAKVSDRIVGFAGIYQKSGLMSHIGTVGIAVHPDYQRMGIGAKLLTALIQLAKKEGLTRLEADTLANNKPMIRIAQKAGFKLEGIRKMRINKDGQHLDEALLALSLS